MTWDELIKKSRGGDGYFKNSVFLSFFKIYRINSEYDSYILLPPDKLVGEPYYIFVWYNEKMRILENGGNFLKMKRNIRQYLECQWRAKQTKPTNKDYGKLIQIDCNQIESNTQFEIAECLINKYTDTNQE